MEDTPGAEAPSRPAPDLVPGLVPDPRPWLALALAAPPGPALCRRLADAFPEPAALRARLVAALGDDPPAARAARHALTAPHGPLAPAHLAALDAPATRRRIDEALAWAAADAAHHLVPIDDPAYPAALRESADPPPLLYLRGALAALRGPAVAIVGSRAASHAGRELARTLARELAEAGLVVASGLALGTDAEAHAGALEARGRGRGTTLAFTATGVDRLYPRRHAALARTMLERGAALASEFPLGHAPQPWCFPQRNRLISGASLGVVVVEAALPSGSLTTARHALEQGREVMAVPGPATSPTSRGCHALIRDGATLVTDAREVLLALAGPLERSLADASSGAPAAPPAVRSPHPDDPARDADAAAAHLGALERRTWDCLAGGPASLDRLIARSGLGVPALLDALAALELAGLLERERGGRYARRERARG